MSMTAYRRYSTPCSSTMVPVTAAMAPVAPEIMAGRPPNTAVMMPMIHAAVSPTNGSTPATNENATASGTCANATVMPHRASMGSKAAGMPVASSHWAASEPFSAAGTTALRSSVESPPRSSTPTLSGSAEAFTSFTMVAVGGGREGRSWVLRAVVSAAVGASAAETVAVCCLVGC